MSARWSAPRVAFAGAVAAIAAAGAVVAALTYTGIRVQGRAPGDIQEYLESDPSPERTPVVCAGASVVRGRASVDFVELLRERFPARTFVNAGVNANVAYELAVRVDDVLRCWPSHVIVLIGTNDVQATLSPAAGEAAKSGKHLPQTPTLEWYRELLFGFVTTLQRSGIKVGVCSLPPLGQDLADPVNARVREFNSVVRQVAEETGAGYLSVYERCADELLECGAATGPSFSGSWRPGLDSLVRHYLLGQSFDDIASSQGLVLSPDLVHLNSRGAGIVADCAAEFLEER